MVKLYAMYAVAAIALSACKSEVESNTQNAQAANANSAIEKSLEVCGTVLVNNGKIYLQISNDNSEKNSMPELRGSDVETTNALQAIAEKLGNACISADFSKEIVTVSSIAAIKK